MKFSHHFPFWLLSLLIFSATIACTDKTEELVNAYATSVELWSEELDSLWFEHLSTEGYPWLETFDDKLRELESIEAPPILGYEHKLLIEAYDLWIFAQYFTRQVFEHRRVPALWYKASPLIFQTKTRWKDAVIEVTGWRPLSLR